VDRFHAWRAAIGSLPAFHDRLTTGAVFVADFGTLCGILPSRFVAGAIICRPVSVYSGKFACGRRESMLDYPFYLPVCNG
jgi:hypothetical protein